MKTTTAVLVALAASSAAGNPIASKREDDDVWPSKEEFCNLSLTEPEAIEERWTSDALSATIDDFIEFFNPNKNGKNWLVEWEKKLLAENDGGKAGSSGCSTIGEDCDPLPGTSCFDLFERATSEDYTDREIRDAYWVFEAVKGMHDKFGELSRLMTKDTVVSGFRIPEMIDAFSGKEEDASDALAWLAAAIGMGGTAAGMAPGVGGPMSEGAGIISDIISQVADQKAADQEEEESEVEADMTTKLVDAFADATDALENTLRIATGGGESEEDYDTLPAPVWDTYDSPIAKFFNGGWWLLDSGSDAVQDLYKSVKGNLQRKVASDIMNGAGNKLIIDRTEDLDNEEKCEEKRGRRWMEFKDGKSHCFYIAKLNHKNSKTPSLTQVSETVVDELDEDFYESMKKYGLDKLEDYYKGVLDCALNGGEDKEVDLSNVSFGQTPTCYFKLETRFADPCKTMLCQTEYPPVE